MMQSPPRLPSLAALAFTLLACRIPNEEHCGRRLGDTTCRDLEPSRPYCSLCEPEHDGCVESLAQIPSQCRPSGVADASGTGVASETGGDTGTGDESDAGSTETGSETGPAAECGNGVKEAGEACDGMDFGDASCGDPYQLPEGTLACVPGECVIDTSQCCLLDAEVCEPGECCNANCNVVTNKCGL